MHLDIIATEFNEPTDHSIFTLPQSVCSQN